MRESTDVGVSKKPDADVKYPINRLTNVSYLNETIYSYSRTGSLCDTELIPGERWVSHITLLSAMGTFHSRYLYGANLNFASSVEYGYFSSIEGETYKHKTPASE